MAFTPNYQFTPSNVNLPSLIFTQLSNQVVTGTTETSLIGSGIGSRIILPNNLRVGSILQGFISGLITTGGLTDTLTIKLKFGSVTVMNITSPIINPALSSQAFKIDFDLKIVTIGGTGSCMGTGRFVSQSNITAPINFGLLSVGAPSSTVTIDTTISNLIDMTLTHNNSNTTTSINTELFILN